MENEEAKKGGLLSKPVFNTRVKSANVKMKEMIFGYFLGPFGALLTSGIFSSVLNSYFTDVLFKDSWSEGNPIATFLMLLPLLSTVLVVAGNLVMGQLLERTKSLQGKARPWILLSALTLSIGSVAMFIVPFSGDIARMVWLAIGYNLYYSVAFPIYNTANSTLTAISTRNSKQRGLLASVTNVAGLGVMGAGSMIFPILVSNVMKDSIAIWFVVMLVIAIYCAFSCLLQYAFTRERVTEETMGTKIEKVKTPIKQQLKAVASDRTWWVIIIFYLLFQVSGAFKNQSMIYFCKWVVGTVAGDWGMTQAILGVLGAIPMAVAVVFVWPLSNKFGKKNVTIVGMIIGVAGGIIAGIWPTNMVPVAIGVALKCLGSAPACYMILAMIADMLDHLEAKNGFRCDGFTMSIYSSIMVAATGIATAVLNGLLGANGYNAKLTAGVDTQLTGVFTATYVWVETIAYAACALILLLFTVEKNLPAEQKAIVDRQREAALAAGEDWIEPAERLRLEQEEADRIAEEARISESKAYCEKKGISFDEREAAYQAKLAEKAAKKKAKEKPKDNGDKTE